MKNFKDKMLIIRQLTLSVCLSTGCLLLVGCGDVKNEWWKEATDSVAPGAVSNVLVTNISGGAIITYTRPADADLYGVKALYEKGGETLEKYASSFSDSLLLEGFGDTNKYSVELFAVDKSGNVSEGVTVDIQPLRPPIEIIRESMTAQAVFGGVLVSWENPTRADIALTLYVQDSTGQYVYNEAYYSDLENGRYTFKGVEQEIDQNFRVELRDRWDNYGQPFDCTLAPLLEIPILGKVDNKVWWSLYGYLDNTLIKRGDYFLAAANFPRMFDGGKNNSNYWGPYSLVNNFFAGSNNGGVIGFPNYFTIDMGRRGFYSGLKFWLRDISSEPIGWSYHPVDFEVWGSNNPKPVSEIGDGDQIENLRYWTSWTEILINTNTGELLHIDGTDEWQKDGTWEKLGDCKFVMPSSGFVHNTEWNPPALDAEDQAFIRNGITYSLDPVIASTKSFRYIRFKVYDTNSGFPGFHLSEIEFLGKYDEQE